MENKEQLEKRIKQIELQLKKLSFSNRNEVCEDLISSLILQKAVMKKQLETMEKNPVIESIKRILPHKEKLICDYFS